jgi:hypothetical protein
MCSNPKTVRDAFEFAFEFAFEHIKPTDRVIVGMYPRQREGACETEKADASGLPFNEAAGPPAKCELPLG